MDRGTMRRLMRGFLPAAALGVFPFRFREGQLSLSPLFLLYGLCLRAVFAFLCLHANVDVLRQRGRFDFFGGILVLNIFLTYFCTVVSYLCLLYRRASLRSLFRSFGVVDRLLSRMEHPCTLGNSLSIDVFMAALAMAGGLFWFFASDSDTAAFMPYAVLSLLNVYATVVPFLQTVAFIRSRLAGLKELLPHVEDRSQRCLLLRLHNALCSKCRIANDCFGLQLLCLYIVIFNNVVTKCYTVSSSSTHSNPALSMAAHTFVILFYGTVCYWVTKACNDTSYEAKGFNDLLYRIMMEDRTKGISTDRMLKLHISMSREVVFTAWGFFSINNSLIHSIIAATTTYLVVLIQFGQPAGDQENSFISMMTENSIFSNTTDTAIQRLVL